MAHTAQERYSSLVDEKLRNTLVTKDNIIFNNRYEGDPKAGKVKIPVRDTKVDVLLDNTGKVIWAYREDIVVVPNSIGGDTSGIKIPFSIHNNGNRTKGTFDLNTKTFTPDGTEVSVANYDEY